MKLLDGVKEVLEPMIDWVVATVELWGYPGIFVMMFLESSFFPFPSEVVMVPAGINVALGKMNFFAVMVAGVGGSIAGAWFNYYLAVKFGRNALLKAPIVNKFVTEEKLQRVEKFFEKHGPISTFNGRLVPLVRQYISFPAGLARMNPLKFTLYTGAGAGIWVLVLTLLGYFFGSNEDLLEEYLGQITIGILLFIGVLTVGYIIYHKRKR